MGGRQDCEATQTAWASPVAVPGPQQLTFSQAGHLNLAEVQAWRHPHREGAFGNSITSVSDIDAHWALGGVQKTGSEVMAELPWPVPSQLGHGGWVVRDTAPTNCCAHSVPGEKPEWAQSLLEPATQPTM